MTCTQRCDAQSRDRFRSALTATPATVDLKAQRQAQRQATRRATRSIGRNAFRSTDRQAQRQVRGWLADNVVGI
jgi:hypothetical protein